jgi:tetratricopeptide (TPR) repeat protein
LVAIVSARGAGPRRAWIGLGALWFALATLTLAETYPVWGSFRGTLGMAGLGIACAAALASRPLALGGLVALRLVMLLIAPRAPQTITAAPPGDGSGFDFLTLARLQRISHETRTGLDRFASVWLPGSRVVWLQRPLMGERAFAHSRALQAWRGDSTAAWAQLEEVVADSTFRVYAGLEYDGTGRPQIRPVAGPRIRGLAFGVRLMRAERYQQALAALPPADQWGEGPVLRGIVAGKRALCWLALEDDANARREAEESLRLFDSGDGHYVIAVLLAAQGKPQEAIGELDSVLSLYPEDPSARMLRDTLVAETKR